MIELTKDAGRRILRNVRIQDRQRLFWWKGPPLNVGDWIGPYLYKAISGIEATYAETSNRNLKTTYVTVGSLARWFCQDSIVWGSGIIERNERMWEPYKTLAVRGPYTRERYLALGYKCPEIFGDPAILLPLFYEAVPTNEFRLGIIPHYCNIDEVNLLFGDNSEILIIDVRQTDVEEFVRQVTKCRRIISSSLHGLILGHAYDIPSAWVEFSCPLGGDGVKFFDYLAATSEISQISPLRIKSTLPLEEIESFVDEFIQPCLEPLRRQLINTCPFPRSRD